MAEIDQLKDRDYRVDNKKKNQLHVVYKKPTLNIKIHVD